MTEQAVIQNETGGLPVVFKMPELEITKFDALKQERYKIKNLYCNVIPAEIPVNDARDIKNKLIKLRTGIDKIVKADRKVLDDIKKAISDRGDELIAITAPEEKKFSEFIDDFDRKEKQKELDRVNGIKKALQDYNAEKLEIITKAMKSKDLLCFDSSLPDFDFQEHEVDAIKLKKEIEDRLQNRIEFLKAKESREETERKQAELKAAQDKLEKERAEFEARIRAENEAKEKEIERLKEITPTQPQIIEPKLNSMEEINDLVKEFKNKAEAAREVAKAVHQSERPYISNLIHEAWNNLEAVSEHSELTDEERKQAEAIRASLEKFAELFDSHN